VPVPVKETQDAINSQAEGGVATRRNVDGFRALQDRTDRNRELPLRRPSARTARDILIKVVGAPDRAGQVELIGGARCAYPRLGLGRSLVWRSARSVLHHAMYGCR
jgi:hypothetical protein